MHDAVIVGFLKGLRQLADDDQDLPLRLRLVGPNEGRERMTLDVGHRNIVRPLDLADVVDRANIGMPQRRRGPGLAVKALQQIGRRLLLEMRRLERDLSLELRVLGQVDHSHGALAQGP